MEGFTDKVISGFKWEASTRLIVQISSWVSTIWVARLLTPDDYGIVGISGIFTGLLLKMAGMGLGQALVNLKDPKEYDFANVFWGSGLLSLFCYLILFLLAPYIADYYEVPELKNVLRFGGTIIVLSAMSIVPQALVMRNMNFKAAALIYMFANFIVTILTLAFAYLNFRYWSLVLSTWISEIFILIAFTRMVRFLPSRPSNVATMMPLFKYGANIVSATLIGYLNWQWATIYSGSFLGKTITGHFQMAHTLAGLPMTKIGELFNKIAFPSFSRIKEDTQRTKSVFLVMHRYLFMITLPMFIGLAVVVDLLIPILLGEKWIPIIVPVQILCVLNVFRISAQIIPSILEGIGNTRANVHYQALLVPIMGISMLIGVQWGLNGMLIAWALSYPIAYIHLLRVLFKNLNIHASEFWQSILPTIVSATVMVGCIVFFTYLIKIVELNSFILLAFKVLVGVVSFYGCYFVLNKQHLIDMLRLVRRA